MKRGRPRKKPRTLFGRAFWFCPRVPALPGASGVCRERQGHWVAEHNMAVARGHVHTYCRACARDIAKRWRDTNPERWAEIKAGASKV